MKTGCPHQRGLRIRIPYLFTNDFHEPMRDCVLNTAERCKMEPVKVALLASHFFEAVADQVLQNRIVRIPGFGAIGPKTRFRKAKSRNGGNLPAAYPAFVPSTRLKYETRNYVPPAPSPECDRMRSICNSYRKGAGRHDLAKTFEHYREALITHNKLDPMR